MSGEASGIALDDGSTRHVPDKRVRVRGNRRHHHIDLASAKGCFPLTVNQRQVLFHTPGATESGHQLALLF